MMAALGFFVGFVSGICTTICVVVCLFKRHAAEDDVYEEYFREAINHGRRDDAMQASDTVN